ncbi:MAG: GatB/YqeY domain-containing protein [Gaiellales bacterium]
MIDRIQSEVRDSLRAGDATRTGALRMLLSALQRAAKDGTGDLTEERAQAVLRRERKQRVEAAEAYEAAGRPDRAQAEQAEARVIDEFLPAAMSDEELARLVDEAIAETGASSMRDMGRVMGTVTQRSGGRADGRAASQLVRARLGG